MNWRGLPATTDAEWSEWLASFPEKPNLTLESAMAFVRKMEAHLAPGKVPAADRLSAAERRCVAADLLHYYDSLDRIASSTFKIPVGAFATSVASLAGAAITGAVVPLGLFGVAVALYGLYSGYDEYRRQRILGTILDKIDELAWDLKRQ